MMLIQIVQHMTPCLADINAWGDISHSWFWQTTSDLGVLAQQFDTDVFKGTRAILNNFVKSGQLWAMVIGIVIGYVLKSLTSYG